MWCGLFSLVSPTTFPFSFISFCLDRASSFRRLAHTCPSYPSSLLHLFPMMSHVSSFPLLFFFLLATKTQKSAELALLLLWPLYRYTVFLHHLVLIITVIKTAVTGGGSAQGGSNLGYKDRLVGNQFRYRVFFLVFIFDSLPFVLF